LNQIETIWVLTFSNIPLFFIGLQTTWFWVEFESYQINLTFWRKKWVRSSRIQIGLVFAIIILLTMLFVYQLPFYNSILLYIERWLMVLCKVKNVSTLKWDFIYRGLKCQSKFLNNFFMSKSYSILKFMIFLAF
jgi:hypothetical protein